MRILASKNKNEITISCNLAHDEIQLRSTIPAPFLSSCATFRAKDLTELWHMNYWTCDSCLQQWINKERIYSRWGQAEYVICLLPAHMPVQTVCHMLPLHAVNSGSIDFCFGVFVWFGFFSGYRRKVDNIWQVNVFRRPVSNKSCHE